MTRDEYQAKVREILELRAEVADLIGEIAALESELEEAEVED